MRLALGAALLFFLLGCFREPGVTLRVRNLSQHPVTGVELDYGKSFGIAELKPAEARDRFVSFYDAAQLKLTYSDSAGRHVENGPSVAAGDVGLVEALISETGVSWKTDLHHH